MVQEWRAVPNWCVAFNTSEFCACLREGFGQTAFELVTAVGEANVDTGSDIASLMSEPPLMSWLKCDSHHHDLFALLMRPIPRICCPILKPYLLRRFDVTMPMPFTFY